MRAGRAGGRTGEGRRRMTAVREAVVPVVAAPSPRVLWSALGNEVGLALWLRTPVPALSRQIDGLMRQAEFEVVASGTADDVSAEVRAQILRLGHDRPGPLCSDVSVLATLFTQVTTCSGLRLRLAHTAEAERPDLAVEPGGLVLVCTYAGRGMEWQDMTGAVRRMPASQVGLFKGRKWPDEAIRVAHRPPATSHLCREERARLVLRLERLDYA
jgi:hypothetical protein